MIFQLQKGASGKPCHRHTPVYWDLQISAFHKPKTVKYQHNKWILYYYNTQKLNTLTLKYSNHAIGTPLYTETSKYPLFPNLNQFDVHWNIFDTKNCNSGRADELVDVDYSALWCRQGWDNVAGAVIMWGKPTTMAPPMTTPQLSVFFSFYVG